MRRKEGNMWIQWGQQREKKEMKKKQKQEADVFEQVLESITKIIRELWLEHNMDHHRPLKR